MSSRFYLISIYLDFTDNELYLFHEYYFNTLAILFAMNYKECNCFCDLKRKTIQFLIYFQKKKSKKNIKRKLEKGNKKINNKKKVKYVFSNDLTTDDVDKFTSHANKPNQPMVELKQYINNENVGNDKLICCCI